MPTCAGCGAGVPAGAKFCPACGTPVEARCPSCSAVVDSTHRFCAACGTALGAPVTTGAEPATTEQRRTISVLFADLAGFTSHTERSDPEDVRARLTTFHAQARKDVERHGGRVEKLLGDGVFAVFGTPVATRTIPNAPSEPRSGCRSRSPTSTRATPTSPSRCASR